MTVVTHDPAGRTSFPYANAEAIHQRDANVLVLVPVDNPVDRLDGEKGVAMLRYAWLSNPAHLECVQGMDWIYLSQSEYADAQRGLADEKTLFDMFSLF